MHVARSTTLLRRPAASCAIRSLARTAVVPRRAGTIGGAPLPSLLRRSANAQRTMATSSVRRYAEMSHSPPSFDNPSADEAERLSEVGTTALEAGDVADARKAFQSSIEAHESSTAWFNLGVCHYIDKDVAQAVEAWKKAIGLQFEYPDAHTNLASAYVMSVPSRPDLAVEHLKIAVGLTPDDPEIHYNLAAVLEACEQLEEAATSYERAYDGGVVRAKENLRNVKAKILAIKAGPRPEGLDDAAKILLEQQKFAEKRQKRQKGGE